MRRAFVGALLSLLVAFPSIVNACSCTNHFLTEQLYHPRTVHQWDEARLATIGRFASGAMIFEGTVEKQDVLTWNVTGKLQTEEKYRLVTFRAKRVYRGPSQPEFVVQTGMGGGDCGFDFAESNTLSSPNKRGRISPPTFVRTRVPYRIPVRCCGC
jgi:hypothetical protein